MVDFPIDVLSGPKTHICWTPDNTPVSEREMVVLVRESDLRSCVKRQGSYDEDKCSCPDLDGERVCDYCKNRSSNDSFYVDPFGRHWSKENLDEAMIFLRRMKEDQERLSFY